MAKEGTQNDAKQKHLEEYLRLVYCETLLQQNYDLVLQDKQAQRSGRECALMSYFYETVLCQEALII